MNIMFVCTGNTCRSPMLARMFADYARKVGFGCAADSAGMKGGGSPVNPKAACTLAARGLDSDGHISKVFGDAEAGWADFVFTMDEGQRDELRLRYPELRVECLSAFCGSEIADPYAEGRRITTRRRTFSRHCSPLFWTLSKKIPRKRKRTRERPFRDSMTCRGHSPASSSLKILMCSSSSRIMRSRRVFTLSVCRASTVRS